MMMSPEAARGLCGGGSDCTCRPPLHPAPPHIPTYTPSTPSSGWEQEHSCAGRQSRRRRRRKRRGRGREGKEERGREEERGKMMGWGGMGVSVPHAGVLTGNVGKQN